MVTDVCSSARANKTQQHSPSLENGADQLASQQWGIPAKFIYRTSNELAQKLIVASHHPQERDGSSRTREHALAKENHWHEVISANRKRE